MRLAWHLLNIAITSYKNAFDPDSKGLSQNKHFFELAAAQWDSPWETVQKKKIIKKVLSLAKWIPSKCVIAIMLKKVIFHLQSFSPLSKIKGGP